MEGCAQIHVISQLLAPGSSDAPNPLPSRTRGLARSPSTRERFSPSRQRAQIPNAIPNGPKLTSPQAQYNVHHNQPAHPPQTAHQKECSSKQPGYLDVKVRRPKCTGTRKRQKKIASPGSRAMQPDKYAQQQSQKHLGDRKPSAQHRQPPARKHDPTTAFRDPDANPTHNAPSPDITASSSSLEIPAHRPRHRHRRRSGTRRSQGPKRCGGRIW